MGDLQEFWHEARVKALLKRPPSTPVTQLAEPIQVRVRATTGTVTHYTPTHALYHSVGWAGELLVKWGRRETGGTDLSVQRLVKVAVRCSFQRLSCERCPGEVCLRHDVAVPVAGRDYRLVTEPARQCEDFHARVQHPGCV